MGKHIRCTHIHVIKKLATILLITSTTELFLLVISWEG